jgi:tetratricopeptide (TPR) repeat protein
MKNKFILVFVILVTAFLSCDDYVDIEPKGILTPKSVDDLRAVLNESNTFENASQTSDYYINDDFTLPTAKVNTFKTAPLFTSDIGNKYNLKGEFFTVEQDDRDWNTNYKMIGRANYVLQTLKELKGNQDQMNQLRGEALIHRASGYLVLVNLYSRHYAAGDPNEPETGLPLVTEFGDAGVSLVRSTIQQVYDLIVADLTEAVTLVGNNESAVKYKPSKIAAYGLLARAYHHMGKYDLAVDNASKALAINKNLLNYATDLTALENTLGDPTGLLYAAFKNNKEVLLHRRGILIFVSTIAFNPTRLVQLPFTYMTPSLISLYDTTNDARYTKLTAVDATAGGAIRWTGADKFFFYHLMDLTIPEVLLIRAESNARLNKIQLAMDDLNYLRLNRFTTTNPLIVNLTAATKAEAIQHVLNERRRELCFRGVRFFDMKRLNAIDNANLGIIRKDLDGNDVSLPANDPRWAMPIPPLEMLLRPEIKQNPR